MGDVARYTPGQDLRPLYNVDLYSRGHPSEEDNVYPIVLVCLGTDGQARVLGMVVQDEHPTTPAGRGALYFFDQGGAGELVAKPESDGDPIFLTQGGAPLGLMPWSIGGLGLSKQSDTGIYVAPGILVIDGRRYHVAATLTKALAGLSADVWVYVYAKPPASGFALSAAEIEYTTTAPSFDAATLTWRHPTNSTWRMVGYFRTNGSSQVLDFYLDNGWFRLQDTLWSLFTTSPATTYTTISLDLPALGVPMLVEIQGYAQNNSNSEGLYIREVGSAETDADKNRMLWAVNTAEFATRLMKADGSRQIQYRVDRSSGSIAGIAVSAFPVIR
jgi:hypothetical protein